jgi:hypothetical protein
MYFVPLISPTLVEMEISTNDGQHSRLVSYEKTVNSKSFSVSCEFEMLGKGSYKTIFNSPEIIEILLPEQDKDEPMTNVLDYIKFDGEGFGCFEVRGTITGSTQTVTRVDVHFNARGRKSPVTIGLYYIKPKDGQFKYENKYNEIIARVATLTFKKSEGKPKMEVKLVSVNKATHPNGFISKLKGTIANWFLNPVEVSKIGNDTMLNFGLAMLNEKSSFTFPRATNIKETRNVTMDNNAKSPAISGDMQK